MGSAANPLEVLPVAEVFTRGNGVEVKLGEGAAKSIFVVQPDTTLYSDAPYLFSAVGSNGDEPFIKTFGTLLQCDGGILTIGQTRYRIQAQPQQKQTGDSSSSTVSYPFVSTVPEELQPVVDFARQQLEAKTDHRAMSVASYDFARLLLNGVSLSIEIDAPNQEKGSTEDSLTPYSWTVETKDNEIVNKGEHNGTPGARDWFKQHFLEESDDLGLVVVTGDPLPEIKANGRSTAGKGDLVIGHPGQLKLAASPYEQAYGLVELKTSRLKPAQNVLELASLATISRFQKNVTLLASDCTDQWELKCWEDFKALLDKAESRVLAPPTGRYKPTLPNFEEAGEHEHEAGNFGGKSGAAGEQDLDGFDYGGDHKHIESQAMLDALATQLADIYGERPVLPQWARAETTSIPDYYIRWRTANCELLAEQVARAQNNEDKRTWRARVSVHYTDELVAKRRTEPWLTGTPFGPSSRPRRLHQRSGASIGLTRNGYLYRLWPRSHPSPLPQDGHNE
eukprot:scaffold13993_cov51-Attheya_sp.AAC.7